MLQIRSSGIRTAGWCVLCLSQPRRAKSWLKNFQMLGSSKHSALFLRLSFPHAIYRIGRLQRLAVFYCGDHQASKAIVHQLIADSGFVGLDAGQLGMAKELEAPGRMNRAGLIGIAQAKRLLHQLTDPIQVESLASQDVDQSAFVEEASASANRI